MWNMRTFDKFFINANKYFAYNIIINYAFFKHKSDAIESRQITRKNHRSL